MKTLTIKRTGRRAYDPTNIVITFTDPRTGKVHTLQPMPMTGTTSTTFTADDGFSVAVGYLGPVTEPDDDDDVSFAYDCGCNPCTGVCKTFSHDSW